MSLPDWVIIRGIRTAGMCLVTVDGVPLRGGPFEWGDRSPESKQLATAVLAAVVGPRAAARLDQLYASTRVAFFKRSGFRIEAKVVRAWADANIPGGLAAMEPLRPWPADAVMIVASALGTERRETMEAVQVEECRDCGGPVAACTFTIRTAQEHPARHGRPVRFFCVGCATRYDRRSLTHFIDQSGGRGRQEGQP